MRLIKHFIVVAAVTAVLLGTSTGIGFAEDMRFFRIASGSAGGSYFPIAGNVAQVISNPPGARPCDKGGNCAVPGVVGIAQSGTGSVGNINLVMSGAVEAGFAQSDVTYWRYTGTAVFKGEKPAKDLRVITALFQEHVHVVGGKGTKATNFGDLKGKTIGVGDQGSGVLVTTGLVLEAYGLTFDNIKPEYVKGKAAAELVADGHADAYLTVTGAPNGAITELAATKGVKMLTIDGAARDKLLKKIPFYCAASLPANTYAGQDKDVETIAVNTLLVTNVKVDDQLVYDVLKGLYDNKQAEKFLSKGHPRSKTIVLETALNSVEKEMLHPGAARFFREKGLLK
jgi:TRAP transporter TAXI family solute receptor